MNIASKISMKNVLIVSILFKLLVLFLMPNINFPDCRTYMSAGTEFFEVGRILTDNVMPLHPILSYALQYSIVIKIFNIIIATGVVYIVYRLSVAIFRDQNIAMTASIITAFYPFFIFYSITALTETLYIFLLLCAFLLLYKKEFFFACVVIVLSILHRPTLDLLAPLLIFVFSFYVHRLGLKVSLWHVLKYALVYVVLMSPWWLHQYSKYDQFVRLNLGDGIVWYSGNNPLNTSGGGVVGSDKGDDMDLSIFSHIVDPVEKNNAMKQAAFEYIKENPDRFIELAGKKFIRFWRLYPYAPQYEKPLYIVMSLLSYGVILLLSIVYALKYLKNNFRTLSPILLLIAYFTVIHMILIGSIRYRLPLEPFLIIFASYTIVYILRKRSLCKC